MIIKVIGSFIGTVFVLCIGIGAGYMLKSYDNKTVSDNKMAVVDVTAIVNKSAQVQALKSDVGTKTQELAKWLQNAQNEVKAEKDRERQICMFGLRLCL